MAVRENLFKSGVNQADIQTIFAMVRYYTLGKIKTPHVIEAYLSNFGSNLLKSLLFLIQFQIISPNHESES